MAAALSLAGCSVFDSGADSLGISKRGSPNQPTRLAELQGVANAANEEELLGDLEISDIRGSDFGFGPWMICLRGSRAIGPSYFAVFFKNEDYQGVRLSVMSEDCEHQTYSPTGPLPAPKIDVKRPSTKDGFPTSDGPIR
jgi:hypothetical protein